MNTKRLAAASAAAIVMAVTPGCKDVPLLPKWDAHWTLPLPSQRISLLGPFPALVPSGSSASVSFGPLDEVIDGPTSQVLRNLDTTGVANVFITVTKTMALDGTDTLFVARSTADLANAGARITAPITLHSANAQDTATTPIGLTGLQMLRHAADSSLILKVKLSGRVTYTGPTRAVTASDSIGVLLKLTATIAVSQ